jgi:hypothetical protein
MNFGLGLGSAPAPALGSAPALGPAPALAPASAPSATFDVQDADASTSSLLIRVLLVVLILALIGFNVFTYLDDIMAWFGNTFGAPFRMVARVLGYSAADTAQTTVNVTAQGTKSVVDIAAGAATSGIDVLQQTLESGSGSDDGNNGNNGNNGNGNNGNGNGNNGNNKNQARQPQVKPDDDNALETALSHAKKQPPRPDDATSRTQRTGKSGYCYIGEDRGFRSCVKVGEQDTCMSGDIFPTQAICINPRLRQ